MEVLERTALWRDALGARHDDPPAEMRERLRSSYLSFRRRAGLLAGEIARSFDHLTVHDGTHLDALWEMADLAVDDTFTLNPSEAYVLGGAILLHDLGLSVAAYTTDDPLHSELRWSDAVAVVLEQRLGRFPTRAEIDGADANVERAAEESLLRRLHAVHAERLALASWEDARGERHHLIEDSELRAALGPTIGKLAHSHWWETAELQRQFGSPLGALPGYPREWTVDPLKLACLLRVADAIHLDARRAPMFLRVLRRPTGVAAHHWSFQERLLAPQVRDDRILFTSGAPFPASECHAWWLCFETLTDVDRWLREVDDLLADTGRPRLKIVGVAGADAPERLAGFIPTDGWSPVDTHIQISNVAGLVEKLGGRELYGDNPVVALRELIQNAADAVRARRKLQQRSDDWGEIAVRMGTDDEGPWLEVQDTGVGMTEHVLTKGLLDFGTSYWASPDLPSEFPGLLASGFEAAGRFGIGFFSVFMLGRKVRVTTRPYRAGEADTVVLEFSNGPSERPLLRPATEQERLWEGGTTVHVTLDEAPGSGLLRGNRQTLAGVGRELCIALDVAIKFEGAGSGPVQLRPDWRTVSADVLLRRARGSRESGELPVELVPYLPNVRPILNDEDEIVARLAIAVLNQPADYRRIPPHSAVAIGGLRANPVQRMIGVAAGRAVTAARDVGLPLAHGEHLARWASEQAFLISSLDLEPERLADHANVVIVCGGDPGPLPIARIGSTWATLDQLRELVRPLEDVVVIRHSHDDEWRHVEFDDHILAIRWQNLRPLVGPRPFRRGVPSWPPRDGTRPTVLRKWIYGAIADAWSLEVDDLLIDDQFADPDRAHEIPIGRLRGTRYHVSQYRATTIRRPG